jgi:hypothetical protein
MLEAGEGPRLMKCGRRTLISVEGAGGEPVSVWPQHHGRQRLPAIAASAKIIGAGA